MTIVEKIVNGIELSDSEVRDLVWEGADGVETVEIIEGDELSRWTRGVVHILLVDGNFYRVYFEQGLTEYQENYYPDQKAERVYKKEKLVMTTTWSTKESDN